MCSQPMGSAWRGSAAWLGAQPEVVVAETPETPATPVVADAADDPGVVILPGQTFDTVIRVRASGLLSSYSYVQDPIGDGGPLLDKTIVVGTRDGDGPATPVGIDVGARAFIEAFPYVGLTARYRSAWYSVTAAEFEGAVAKDALQYAHVAAVGRLPIRLGGADTLHFGLRVGAEYSDFIYFTGDLEARFIEYTTLSVPALAIGGEAGLELGSTYGVLSYDGGLAYGTDPFSGRLDLEGGVDIGAMTLSAGVGHVARERIITGSSSGNDLGTVRDRQWYAQLGLGIRL